MQSLPTGLPEPSRPPTAPSGSEPLPTDPSNAPAIDTLRLKQPSCDLHVLRCQLARGLRLLGEADRQLELLSFETLPALSKRLDLLQSCRQGGKSSSRVSPDIDVAALIETTAALLPSTGSGATRSLNAYQQALAGFLRELTNRSPEAILFREEAGRAARSGLQGLDLLAQHCTGLPRGPAQAALEQVLSLSLLETLEGLETKAPQQLCETARSMLRELRAALIPALGTQLSRFSPAPPHAEGELAVLLRVYSLATLDRAQSLIPQTADAAPDTAEKDLIALWWKDFRLLRTLDRAGILDDERFNAATLSLRPSPDTPYVLLHASEARTALGTETTRRAVTERLGTTVFGLTAAESEELPGEGLELLCDVSADLPDRVRNFLSACIRETPEQCLFPPAMRARCESVAQAVDSYLQLLGCEVPAPLRRLPHRLSARQLLGSLLQATADLSMDPPVDHQSSESGSSDTFADPAADAAEDRAAVYNTLRRDLVETVLESALSDVFPEEQRIGGARTSALAFVLTTSVLSTHHAVTHDRLISSLAHHGFTLSHADLKELLSALGNQGIIPGPQNPRLQKHFPATMHTGLSYALAQMTAGKGPSSAEALPAPEFTEADHAQSVVPATLLSLDETAAEIRGSIQRLQDIFDRWLQIETRLFAAAKQIGNRGADHSLVPQGDGGYEDQILTRMTYRKPALRNMSLEDEGKRFGEAINDAWRSVKNEYFARLDKAFRDEATHLCSVFATQESLLHDAAAAFKDGERLFKRAAEFVAIMRERIPGKRQIFGSDGVKTIKKHQKGRHVEVEVMVTPNEATKKLQKLLDKVSPVPRAGREAG